MRKFLILIGGMIMCLFITGCFHSKDQVKKEDIKDLKAFRFSYTVGYYMNADFSYEVELQKSGKYNASYKASGIAPEDKLEKEISETVVLELEELMKKHNIHKWNEFHKNDPNVLDGNSFSLSFYSNSEKSISASGYMMYPAGYREFKEEIDSFFQQLFEKEIAKQKTTFDE